MDTILTIHTRQCFSGSPRILEVTKKNITSALHVPVTLSVQLQAYPVPTNDNFSWQKCDSSTCQVLDSADGFNVTTVGLVSNLTIENVEVEHFGQYTLNVTNGVGKNGVFNLYLSAQGMHFVIYMRFYS